MQQPTHRAAIAVTAAAAAAANAVAAAAAYAAVTAAAVTGAEEGRRPLRAVACGGPRAW